MGGSVFGQSLRLSEPLKSANNVSQPYPELFVIRYSEHRADQAGRANCRSENVERLRPGDTCNDEADDESGNEPPGES